MIMFFAFGVFLYKNQSDSNYAATKERLITMGKIVDISILDGSLHSDYIKDLARRSETYIGVLDKELGKFYISDDNIITMDIFLGIKDANQKISLDVIDNEEVMYYAQDTIIDDRNYIIAVAKDINTTNVEFKDLINNLLIIFVICLALSYIIAKIFNKIVNLQLEQISDFLNKIAQKDFTANLKKSRINEFNTISQQLESMKEELKKNHKRSRKQSAKIRLKNTQLEGILSSVSHEFKNPIAIIQASSQTIKNDKNLPPDLRNKFIDKIVKNSTKIVNLIDKLRLSFADDSLVLDLTSFNLVELSCEVANELKEKFPQRNIIIYGKEKIIRADRDMLHQAIYNLVENGIKYSKDDVEIRHTARGIFITDKGVGIGEEDLKLVTKKFFRANQNDWNNSLGLGLYIVKHILKLHNFKIIIRSELGGGSTFGFEV